MPPIKINGYTLAEVQTHGKYTGVKFTRPMSSSHPNGRAQGQLIFVDKNKNGRLDAGDRATHRTLNNVRTPGSISSSVRVRSVAITAKVIAQYGKHVSAVFRFAQRERATMRRSLPAQKNGFCGVMRGRQFMGQFKNYSPRLDISTRRAKLKQLYTLRQLVSTAIVDPANCQVLNAIFPVRIRTYGLVQNKTVSQKVMMSFGDMAIPVMSGLSSMGVSNHKDLVDVSYALGSLAIVHIDIAK